MAVADARAPLTGLPLNRERTALGGTLLRTARTAPGSRVVALAGTGPPEPGLVREPGWAGPGIGVEVRQLSPAAFGRFVAGIP